AAGDRGAGRLPASAAAVEHAVVAPADRLVRARPAAGAGGDLRADQPLRPGPVLGLGQPVAGAAAAHPTAVDGRSTGRAGPCHQPKPRKLAERAELAAFAAARTGADAAGLRGRAV